MMHKIHHSIEAAICLLAIHWQPVFGVIASVAAILYYGSILKINVVDVKYEGSWKKYFKSIIKLK